METKDMKYGKYQHYKTGKLYKVIGVARHSETHEEMVIYKALYQCDAFGSNQVWVRPMAMFMEKVIYDGNYIPRFKRIDQ